MDFTLLPHALMSSQGSTTHPDAEAVRMVPYESYTPSMKGKSRLQQNMLSLLMEGEKLIHYEGSIIHYTPRSILLLGSGNYLFTERLSPTQKVNSIMLFFDDALLPHVENRKAVIDGHPPVEPTSHVLFPKDEYIGQFIQSLQTLLATPALLTPAMQTVKLTELLVYLCHQHPALYTAFQHRKKAKPEEQVLKQTVEENIGNNLLLDELAFLCNMSLATFKRKFTKLYNTSPARWLQQRRLEAAARLLAQQKGKPTDLYLQAGYENHSSFSQAFKAHFGVSPKDYAMEKSAI
jgi:AraC family transcriptional regulator, exoenzyme S synthesis regulatory protein ExsA